MAKDKIKTLRVAAIQMESRDGDINTNLEHAVQFVEEAAHQGAKLVLLPEFMPTGFRMTKDIWDSAEPREGLTVRWLKRTSKRLNIWLGTSFLEAEGTDFFNTFILTTPDGEEAGRVRKQTPALVEAYFFKGAANHHVINTTVGKIGVGICYEAMLAYFPQLMYKQSVDLVLLPHSAPTPMQSPFFPRKQVEFCDNTLKEHAHRYAKLLGVPVVMANKSGKWKTEMPRSYPPQNSIFPGLSSIADSDGNVKAQLKSEEGVIVGDVSLDSSKKAASPPQTHGRWTMKLPWYSYCWQLMETIGKISYRFSPERKSKAQRIASNS